jgi:DNA-binding NtrC family response regulator
MPVELQVRLLRVLETGAMLRVGGDREIRVDVRVVAATNRDPEDAVKSGKLRQDLYYRLQVFPIQLPPLREREGDVVTLARHFLGERNRIEGTTKHISQDALAALARYGWPGNVRELRNVVDRAYILADDEITPECLPPEISGEERPTGPFIRVRVGTPISEAEKRLILATLRELQGDKKRTAETLGVSLKTLYNRLHEYGFGPAGPPPD